MKPAPKIKASSQKFIEIKDIIDDIVILEGGNACLLIKIEACNFGLLSEQEKTTKIYSYIALLNSLSFSVQILIKNQKIDLSSYLDYLTREGQKIIQQNQKFIEYFKNYKDFIQKTITINSVLDKNFYIVVPYSYLETGISGAKSKTFKKDEFANQAKAALTTKANSIHSQLARLSLKAKTLEKEELIKTFYRIYNESEHVQTADDIRAAFVTIR